MSGQAPDDYEPQNMDFNVISSPGTTCQLYSDGQELARHLRLNPELRDRFADRNPQGVTNADVRRLGRPEASWEKKVVIPVFKPFFDSFGTCTCCLHCPSHFF